MIDHSKYKLVASTQREGHHDWRPTAAKCAILVDVVETGAMTATKLDPVATPALLCHAPALLRNVCVSAATAGFLLRLDVPPDCALARESPVYLSDAPAVDAAVKTLQRIALDSRTYPASLWGIPKEHRSRIINHIEAFFGLRYDANLFDDVIAAGAFRLALGMSSLTMSLPCADLQRGVGWFQEAARCAELPVNWF